VQEVHSMASPQEFTSKLSREADWLVARLRKNPEIRGMGRGQRGKRHWTGSSTKNQRKRRKETTRHEKIPSFWE